VDSLQHRWPWPRRRCDGVRHLDGQAPPLNWQRTLGVRYTLDVEKYDAAERIRELTGGYGADIVLECSGVSCSCAHGSRSGQKAGQVYSKSDCSGSPSRIDFEKIAFKEIVVNGTVSAAPARLERTWVSWNVE